MTMGTFAVSGASVMPAQPYQPVIVSISVADDQSAHQTSTASPAETPLNRDRELSDERQSVRASLRTVRR